MIKTKYYCDRCKKEMDRSSGDFALIDKEYFLNFQLRQRYLRLGMLCKSCAESLIGWFDEEGDEPKSNEYAKIPETGIGDLSDGYHTFNQLYHQRAVLFATIVNTHRDKAWKSFKHEDGAYCFDSNGEWFIVGVDTPEGSYTYHYEKTYWDMFDCEELEHGKHWDGHTEEDVTRLLSLVNKENR